MASTKGADSKKQARLWVLIFFEAFRTGYNVDSHFALGFVNVDARPFAGLLLALKMLRPNRG